MLDSNDAAFRLLKAEAVEAAQREPATDTVAAIDAELKTRSDASIARLVEYDAPDHAMPWDSMSIEERRGWRARNEAARRRYAAQQQAVAAVSTAAVSAQQQAAGDAQRATLRTALAVPGLSGAALESAIDQVLTTRAIAGQDALLEQKRRAIGGL